MGTDIHLYVEKRIDGVWDAIAPPERDLKLWPKDQTRTLALLRERMDPPRSWGNPIGYEMHTHNHAIIALDKLLAARGGS